MATAGGETPGPGRAPRADRLRNRDRILGAAVAVVARDGASASLELVAREAGVGSATLHRHFPSRTLLLEAVFSDRVRALCDRADELAAQLPPEEALSRWLAELADYAASTRGLADTLLASRTTSAGSLQTCHTMLRQAGERLLHDAVAAGTVRPLPVDDLLGLADGISHACQHDPGSAGRLMALALQGIQV
ncbi:TetR/AcrR family transcriptional regulator [Auraticoccus monumenti]|uniref:DNA-binding transcriptional regulator, AcrR family n=1 Tax=Auraticoccus monumenti TaxID=675864 RepID=A0A1G7BFJ2_9ACTN|nr:TetR/AcrR family transcriptional regulator [Auraticoccus monumenti]SDE25848.1 DNA-binding transcriptional regulator, AcrR family [Auraticoccus monumenti]